MLNYNARVEPSAPPMNPSAPTLYPQLASSGTTSSPGRQSPGRQQLNVPPMMYSVPGTIQQGQVRSNPSVPTAALRPVQQPPPAPSLNEISLNEERQRVRCPYCHTSITTKISYRSGTMTHIAAVAVLFVCCPLFWIPYVVDCCKDVDHACPTCGRNIGKFRRFT